MGVSAGQTEGELDGKIITVDSGGTFIWNIDLQTDWSSLDTDWGNAGNLSNTAMWTTVTSAASVSSLGVDTPSDRGKTFLLVDQSSTSSQIVVKGIGMITDIAGSIVWIDPTDAPTPAENDKYKIFSPDFSKEDITYIIDDDDLCQTTDGEDKVPLNPGVDADPDITCFEGDEFHPLSYSQCGIGKYETNLTTPAEVSLTGTGSDAVYRLPESITTNLIGEGDLLKDWWIMYSKTILGNETVAIGQIKTHMFTPGSGGSAGIHAIKIETGENYATAEDAAAIKIYTIIPKIHGIDQSNEPGVGPKNNISISNYIRKDVSFNDELNNIDKKTTCEINNGIWEQFECKSHNGTMFRNVDLCENTGFNWNADENSNTCTKELDPDDDYTNILKTDGTIHTLTDGSISNYCEIKTLVGENDLTNPSPNEACPACKYNQSERKCSKRGLQDCIYKEDNTVRDETNCNTASYPLHGCEYYSDNMKQPTDTSLKPFAEFRCDDNDSSQGSQSQCSGRSTEAECIQPPACEWQCPYLVASSEEDGYTATLTGGEALHTTTSYNNPSYYSRYDITVTCADGWEPTTINQPPLARCISNADDTNELTNDFENRIGFAGCSRVLNCKDNTNNGQPLTSESIQADFITDPDSVQAIFTTGSGDSRILDPTKLPNANGAFECPEPSSLRLGAENITGWSSETCCIQQGLCSGNDPSLPNPQPDIVCPEGQVIKTRLVGNKLEPIVGRSVEVCCEPPQEPTVTLSFDVDNFQQVAGAEDSITRTTFVDNFRNDLVDILNNSASIQESGIVITNEMITILNIEEGSVIVTFKINRDANSRAVQQEQVANTITAGTTFSRVGHVTKDNPSFQAYDPTADCIYYSDKYKICVETDTIIISIIGCLVVCFFALIVFGMLTK